MKTLISVLAFSFILAQPAQLLSTISSEEFDKKLHNQCLYPTVMVAYKSGTGSGSGVIVRSEKIKDGLYHNVVMTCGHIFLMKEVKEMEGIKEEIVIKLGTYKDWSTFTGYKVYSSKVYQWDKDRDLGIVVFASEKEMPVAEIDFNTKLYIGSKVTRIGCGLGDPMRVDDGKVTGLNANVPNLCKETIRTSIFTVPGDSGGPLYFKYKVVGITQAIRSVRLGWNNFPAFKISLFIPVGRFKVWDDTLDDEIEFLWDDKKEMPVIPFKMMELNKLKLVDHIVPENYWYK